MAIKGGLSDEKAADRLSMPESTLERWIRAAKQGKLDEISKSQRPLGEQEFELARVKSELALTRLH